MSRPTVPDFSEIRSTLKTGEYVITPRARHTDPETSHAAASSAKAKAAQCRSQVVRVFQDLPEGLTLADVVHRHRVKARALTGWIDFSDSGVRTRVSELVRSGEVVDSGLRRLTSSGRKAIVWKLRTQ